ncbi:MAG: imidazole glycerol phosphate synthase subunit HisH [Bacillota bacterium]|jgi:glutamine amidotransferase
MIAIIDYGVGNLFSLSSSLTFLNLENKITNSKEDIIKADRIILPGVGAFADAMEKLQQTQLIDTLKEQLSLGKPLLGICLGMQLLFEKSYEYGEHTGLNLIGGTVCPLANDLKKGFKIPHIGWNSLILKKEDPILKYIQAGDFVYYVHSYYAKNCADATIAVSEYDIEITAIVKQGVVYGMQFHPEKSGRVGLNLLKAFAEI